MSRTTRRRLDGWNPGQRVYERAKAEHEAGVHPLRYTPFRGKDFRKDHWCHGRDAYKGKLPVRYPGLRDKGYEGWREIWGMHRKRDAKKLSGRYRRIWGEHQIVVELQDLEDGE